MGNKVVNKTTLCWRKTKTRVKKCRDKIQKGCDKICSRLPTGNWCNICELISNCICCKCCRKPKRRTGQTESYVRLKNKQVYLLEISGKRSKNSRRTKSEAYIDKMKTMKNAYCDSHKEETQSNV